MKYVIFLGDGMSDAPLKELDGKTPLMCANTPSMDWIAKNGISGTVRTLFEGYPTSSDVANMGVLGYDVKKYNCGRGPIEAASQKINLAENDIAFRCNLITVKDNKITDYSGGHITHEESQILIKDLQSEFGNSFLTFYPGVSYRNLLVLNGDDYSPQIEYSKPDDEQGTKIDEQILLRPKNTDSEKQQRTCNLLNDLMLKSKNFLEQHPVNLKRKKEGKGLANMIWLWSPGYKPQMPSFKEKYDKTGAIISAVDVIFGLGELIGLETIRVKGATGWIDTNYEGKADAAVKALEKHDFVFIHVEAPDECSHLGDVQCKIKAIEDFDKRIMKHVIDTFGSKMAYAVLPDHPVPSNLKKHTREPVPVSIYVPEITPDAVINYNEEAVLKGKLGELNCLEFLDTFFNL